MGLHEQYETLLRRGMPKHPRLRSNAAGGNWLMGSWAEGSVVGFGDSDARDLITMHALRWAQGALDGVSRRFMVAPGETVIVPHVSAAPPDGRGPTILDAILAATEHLEPS